MSKNIKMWLAVLIIVVLLAGVSVYAATSYGSKEDPLVAKSYLDSVVLPKLEAELQSKIDSATGNAGDSYSVVTLSNGQRIVGDVGCEIMLRIGSASVSAGDAPGLVDTTGGTTLNNGAGLSANHLYMVTIKGNGIVATADTVKVLVKGGYTIS